MNDTPYYNTEFFQTIMLGSLQSAEIVVPLIKELLNPHSVVDVGCGVGTWLSVFQRYETNILGLDGGYVDKNLLQIDENFFQSVDLEQELTVDKTFDLAISLEVAEHLSEQRSITFVRDLTRLSPLVLFSAAIPFQGGNNHINEQWQSYWVNLFAVHHYKAVDYLRPYIWDNEEVEYWYRQNILLFCREDCIANYPKLLAYENLTKNWQAWDVVHPHLYVSKCNIVRNNEAEAPSTGGNLYRILKKIVQSTLDLLRKHILKKGGG